jgi:outer membrane protein OmpA-like peptidoglycan-associated protein
MGRGRALAGCLVAAVVLAGGCATKKFVQSEVGQSQQKLAQDLARVEADLGQEKARTERLGQELDAARATAAAADRTASEAAGAAQQAGTRAEAAATTAGAATARAEAAEATAREALAKAGDTDQRLTKLWTSRNKRMLADTHLVHFAFDKWVLDDRAQTTLRALVKQLQERPEMTVELEGYTDNVGASAYNIQLSQRRADAVRRFLVEQGIELPRIHWIGLGDIRPVADNKTRQGRDQNRRVSIRVFAPEE